MKSFKAQLILTFSAVVVAIVLFQAALHQFYTGKALKKGTFDSLKLSISQMQVHFDDDLNLYRLALINIANENYIKRFIVDESEINKEYLKNNLSTRKLLDVTTDYGLLNFQGDLIYSSGDINKIIYKRIEKKSNTQLLQEDGVITIVKDGEGKHFVTFVVPIFYKKSIEGAMLTQVPVNFFFSEFSKALDHDFSLHLVFNGNVIARKGEVSISPVLIDTHVIPNLKMAISISEKMLSKPINELIIASIVVSVAILLMAFILIVKWIVPSTVRPINDFQYKLKDVMEKDLSKVDTQYQLKEILSLRDTFNLLLTDLNEKKEESILKSHKAGMAENAVSVLHNIGNIITSIVMRISNSSQTKDLQRLSTLLNKYHETVLTHLNSGNLEYFLTKDVKGLAVLKLLPKFSSELEEINKRIEEDYSFYKKQITHIGEVISSQQTLAKGNFQERTTVEIKPIILDCLKVQSDRFHKHNIKVETDIDRACINVNKHGLSQVVLNFIINAIESIQERRKDEPIYQGKIIIKVKKYENRAFIRIEDNGIGIKKGLLKNIFSFGFSTKNRSSGFGLHNCANYVKANDGNIDIMSGGEMKGVTVKIDFSVIDCSRCEKVACEFRV
jgi:signal transduction histidine kinase